MKEFPPPGVKPCRFCREADWLCLNPDFVTDATLHGPDGALIRDKAGKPAAQSVDYVECLMCGAMAPLAIWNGAEVSARERAALREFYAQEVAQGEAGR